MFIDGTVLIVGLICLVLIFGIVYGRGIRVKSKRDGPFKDEVEVEIDGDGENRTK